MVKKDYSKKPQEPKSFAAFLRKRAPIYLGLLGLFFVFAYPAMTEKNLDSLLDESFEGDQQIAVDMVKFYTGPNDTGITIIEVKGTMMFTLVIFRLNIKPHPYIL